MKLVLCLLTTQIAVLAIVCIITFFPFISPIVPVTTDIGIRGKFIIQKVTKHDVMILSQKQIKTYSGPL